MSALSSLLTEYHALPLLSRRAVAAIVGACVGDGATRPTHWVYDRSVLETTIGQQNPEFWPVSLSPFYTMETGRRSCYNDEALAMLLSLSPARTAFDKSATEASLLKMFSPDSEYAEALGRRLKAYEPSQRTTTRDPIPGPWQQAAVTSFLKAVAEGKDVTGDPTSTETDGFCLSIPLVARLSSEPIALTFDADVETTVRILSASERAVAHSLVRASILRRLIRNGTDAAASSTSDTVHGISAAERRSIVADVVDASADEDIHHEYKAVLDAIPTATVAAEGVEESCVWGSDNLSPAFLNAVESFGKACPDPGNLKASLLTIVTCESYTEGIRRNLFGGGCNCSRSNFIGACLGAAYGIGVSNGIPVEWIVRTDRAVETLELAIKLCKPSL